MTGLGTEAGDRIGKEPFKVGGCKGYGVGSSAWVGNRSGRESFHVMLLHPKTGECVGDAESVTKTKDPVDKGAECWRPQVNVPRKVT